MHRASSGAPGHRRVVGEPARCARWRPPRQAFGARPLVVVDGRRHDRVAARAGVAAGTPRRVLGGEDRPRRLDPCGCHGCSGRRPVHVARRPASRGRDPRLGPRFSFRGTAAVGRSALYQCYRLYPRWSGDACKILKRKGLLLLELRDPTLYPTIGWCRECVSACRLAFAPAGLTLFSRSDPVCLLSCARARSRPLRGAGRASEAPRGPLVGTGVARRRR